MGGTRPGGMISQRWRGQSMSSGSSSTRDSMAVSLSAVLSQISCRTGRSFLPRNRCRSRSVYSTLSCVYLKASGGMDGTRKSMRSSSPGINETAARIMIRSRCPITISFVSGRSSNCQSLSATYVAKSKMTLRRQFSRIGPGMTFLPSGLLSHSQYAMPSCTIPSNSNLFSIFRHSSTSSSVAILPLGSGALISGLKRNSPDVSFDAPGFVSDTFGVGSAAPGPPSDTLGVASGASSVAAGGAAGRGILTRSRCALVGSFTPRRLNFTFDPSDVSVASRRLPCCATARACALARTATRFHIYEWIPRATQRQCSSGPGERPAFTLRCVTPLAYVAPNRKRGHSCALTGRRCNAATSASICIPCGASSRPRRSSAPASVRPLRISPTTGKRSSRRRKWMTARACGVPDVAPLTWTTRSVRRSILPSSAP